MHRRPLFAVLTLLVAGVALSKVEAQQPKIVTFEVASVRPAAAVTDARIAQSMRNTPGRVTYIYASLRSLIARAYRVKEYQVSGPDWLRTQRFDVQAKLQEGASKDQVPEMLQALLAERFKLSLHREKREMPVYELIVGRSGVKMPQASSGRAIIRMGTGYLEAKNMTTSLLAEGLASVLQDRPVVDMTGLNGSFNVKLEFALDEDQLLGMRAETLQLLRDGDSAYKPSFSAEGAPSIFVAVQEQLGLKLESRKAPVEVLVVEHMERAPSEN